MPEMVQAWNVVQMLPQPPGAPAAAMTAFSQEHQPGRCMGRMQADKLRYFS